MADTTPNLALPLLAAAQAQKHVTHNEALVAIDALLQCAVLDKDAGTPPASPAADSRYIVGASPTGAWAGRAGAIAIRRDGAWTFVAPQRGFLAWVVDETLLYAWTGSAWTAVNGAVTALQNLGLLGIGTTADATNPVSAKLNKALWTAKTAGEGGTGDLRYTLNKEAAGNVASFLFQTGYSGRLELGLVGSDNPVLKVSSDGSTWRNAVSIDAASGGIDFLSGEATLASAATTDLGSVPARRVAISGTATITSLGSGRNLERLLRFTGAATLTHNAASLILPGAANLAVAAGDTAFAASDASGNWTLRDYQSGLSQPRSPTFLAVTVGGATAGATFAATISAKVGPSGSGSVTVLTGNTGGGGGQAGSIEWRKSDGTRLAVLGGSATELALGLENGASFTVGGGAVLPATDGGVNLGSGTRRFGTVYASGGVVTTSDARLKTEVAPLAEAEIAAAIDLSRAVGTFRFLEAIRRKGDRAARRHVGLTVQRAAEILRSHGLEPFSYAFLCRDDDPGAVDDAGAGRLGFRPDQLALFMARGLEARLATLERRPDP